MKPIWIVDDDQSIRFVLEKALAREELAVRSFTNAKDVLLALEHYASQVGDFQKAQEFQRRMDALRSSHSLPEDLVQMALEAKRNGDIESMRRHYARLLLQQRQIPSSLYRHVAEAYLELGDSYRNEAEKGDAAARERELEQVREQLKKRAMESEPAKTTDGGHK